MALVCISLFFVIKNNFKLFNADLQQKVSTVTIGDLQHANNVLARAKRDVEKDQQLRFKTLPKDVEIGLAAIHEASFANNGCNRY